MSQSPQQSNSSRPDPFARTCDGDWSSGILKSGESAVIVVRLPPIGSDKGNAATHIVVGRVDAADIRVMDPMMSRTHFEFVNDDEVWKVHDLSSKNGTMLNGEVLDNTLQPVSDGDVVAAGSSSFQVLVERQQ